MQICTCKRREKIEQISYDCEKFLAMCVPCRDRDVI